ncbi:MAG: endonuclease/exonuclease/phosphatase family protein [Spirochaeta sp.]
MILQFGIRSRNLRCACVILVLAAILAGLAVPGCSLLGLDTDRITIMTYNLHNLFDDNADGSEYPEYNPETGNWDSAAYHARLEDFGRVIRGVRGTYGQGPDVVVLAEVENQRVVEDLRDKVLGERRYPSALATAVPGSAIQIGLLSRLPVLDVRLHAVYPFDDRRIRPVLEVKLLAGDTGEADGHELHLFACHWPSKLDGEAETEQFRLMSAAVISRRVEEIVADNPDASVLIAGDLNQTLPENMDQCRRIPPLDEEETVPLRSLAPACILSEGPQEYIAGCTDALRPLFVTAQADKAITDPLIFYSPWYMSELSGSYVYREEWERIDHFLLGPGLMGEGFLPTAFWVEQRDWMLTPQGYPRGYRPSQRSGLSDHLPIVLELSSVRLK